MDYQAIIDKYYPVSEDGGCSDPQPPRSTLVACLGKNLGGIGGVRTLRQLLLKHSRQVADRSLLICDRHPELRLDREFLEEAAMLHDIGICRCHAPSIFCMGTEPYICHGLIGGAMLRELGWVRHALVCERHTGTGLTARQIQSQQLPLPPRDFVPEALEEQVICYADKFYSKSHPDRCLTVAQAAQSLEKFGHEGVTKFLEWAARFE